MLCLWCGFVSGWLFICPPHVATCEDEGVVLHVSWCKYLAVQVRNPVTELIVMRHDKSTPLSVEGMAYGEGGIADIAVFT